MNTLEIITAATPTVVAIFYFITAACWALRGDWAWALVWLSYCVANVGLIILGLRK